jgi:glycine/D-amino acid oxidase-like deaminating enzyme
MNGSCAHTAHGWWLEEAGPVAPRPPLEGAVSADVAIVGGGYAGLWTAWHLLATDPGLQVVVLEADRCGHGPSGRNGGFCESYWRAIALLRASFGDAGARALADASSESVLAIGRFCEEEGVDAWFEHAGSLAVQTAPAHDGFGADAVAAAAALGAAERVQPLDAAAVRARCDAPSFGAGVLVGDFATVQPARLALGLRERAIAHGAVVHERSRVRSLRRGPGGRVALETTGGRVDAGAAVLAINAAARGLPRFRGRLAVASSHVVLTEPVGDVLDELGWTGGESITDARTMLHYTRTTRDRRIAFGWAGGRLAYGARLGGRVELDPGMVQTVREHLVGMFPTLRGRRITHAWGGPIDASPNRLLQIDSVAGDRVHAAFGFSGNGVGPSHLAGRILADLALDRRTAVTRLPMVGAAPNGVPPEPLAWAGGSLVRGAMVRRDRLHEEGRAPDPLTRLACRAPQLLGIHLAR